jgi:molybdopterin converting factor small subunit
MEVSVIFYGVIADVAHTRFRHYSDIVSFDDLRLRLQDDYPEIVHYEYRICHNNTLIRHEPILSDGDKITLLPPFYGG